MEGKESDYPFEWFISRVCEEFNCLPSQAVRELMTDPAQTAIDIMELRAYVKAKEVLDNAKNQKDIPDSPVIDRVFEIQAEILKRRRDETCSEE